MAILFLDKVDFRAKKTTRNKKDNAEWNPNGENAKILFNPDI